MSDTKYAYAVAGSGHWKGLFSSAQIEQLLSVKSYEGALRFLTEHGWGDADDTAQHGGDSDPGEDENLGDGPRPFEGRRRDPGSAFLRGSLPQFKGGDQGCGGAGQPRQCLF